jgi:flagellar assembly factor FliW
LKISTRKFGEIEIDEKNALIMPEGLPGFPGFEKFILLEDLKSAPFCWLQSLEDANLALILMNPLIFKSDYKIDLKGFISSRGKGWEGFDEKDLISYVVINVSEEEEGTNNKITANLMGPIIINLKNNEAIQVAISDSSYSHQHNVLESI